MFRVALRLSFRCLFKMDCAGTPTPELVFPFKRVKLDAVFIPVLDFGGDGPEAVLSGHSEVAHLGQRRAGV